MRAAKLANSDAKSLARFIIALGFAATPERLNDLLVLLAVLMVECGGGLTAGGVSRLPPPAALCSPAIRVLVTHGYVVAADVNAIRAA
jgi:hypothetical protein